MAGCYCIKSLWRGSCRERPSKKREDSVVARIAVFFLFVFLNTRFGQFSYQGQIFVVQTLQSSLGLSGQNTCRDKHLPADDKYLKHGFIFHATHSLRTEQSKCSNFSNILLLFFLCFFFPRATTFVTMMYFIQPEQISLLLSPSQECGRKTDG